MNDEYKSNYIQAQIDTTESGIFAAEVELEAIKAEAKAAKDKGAKEAAEARVHNQEESIAVMKARLESFKSQLAKHSK